MYRLFFLFLFQCVLVGKLVGQNSFDQQHEKFIRLHRNADPDKLLTILHAEEKLIRQKKPKASNAYYAKLALDRGTYFYMIDDYEKSIASFHRAEKLKGLKLSRDRILLYTYLGVSYRNGREDFEKAHLYIDKAIELAEKETDPDLLASAIIKKASNYFYDDQYAQAVRLLESVAKDKKKWKGLTIERKLPIHGLLAQGYNKLGIHAKSYAYFTSSIELAKKTNDDELISDQYHNFIIYFLDRQRYKEAKEQIFEAIKLLKDKPEAKKKLYDSYAMLAQTYSSLNQLDSALYYGQMSHDYALKTGDKESLSISYGTLGHIYAEHGEYEKSLDFLLKSEAVEEQLIDMSTNSDIYHNIGAVYLKMKNYRQSLVYYGKSNKIAYLQGDLYTLQLNYSDLAKSYIGLGNPSLAVVMQDSSFLYYDSLNNIEKNRELLQLEVRYKTKFKDQENKLLKLEVKKHQKAKRDTIVLSLVFIVLLLGIVYILFISNRLRKSKVAEADAQIRNQKLEEELLVQRLSLLTEEINRKNKLIQSLESGANSLAEESLLNNVTLEKDWLAFMSEFDKIHAGYLTELKRQFPDLTTNNLRLAAVVKLEFSNKEIANILCITENGVKKAKQRLKERMKID